MSALASPRFICIGPHHKTGTIWMRTVFRMIARRLEMVFVYAFPNSQENNLAEPGWAVLHSEGDRLMFEMDHKDKQSPDQTLAWDYFRPNGVELRYEDLTRGTDCGLFGAALTELGVSRPDVAFGKRVFRTQSLFGGLAGELRRPRRVMSHVASGRVKQRRTVLTLRAAERYAAQHGDALVQLKYELHPTAWLPEIPDAG